MNINVPLQAPVPDSYRGKYTDKDYSPQEICDNYVREVANLCKAATENGGLSAFIGESMQSCGGQIIFPEGYLREAYR